MLKNFSCQNKFLKIIARYFNLQKFLKKLVYKNFDDEIIRSNYTSVVLFYNMDSMTSTKSSKNGLRWIHFLANKIKNQFKNENINFYHYNM